MNLRLRHILIFIGLIVLGFFLWYFRAIITYVLVSAVLSLVGRPAVNFLDKIHLGRIKIPRTVNALATLVLMWTLLFVFFRIFIPLIASQAEELSTLDMNTVSEKVELPLKNAIEFYNKFDINSDNGSSIEQFLSEKFISVMNFSAVSEFFGALAGLMGNIFIAFFSISFITFFFLKEKDLFYNAIMTTVPDKYVNGMTNVLHSIKKLLTRYFVGIIIQITGIITLVSVGLTIVGLDFSDALITGLVVGIMNVIPYLGPVIGACLGLIFGLATHLELPFYTELLPLLGWMLLVFIIVQVIDNVVFQPFIYSSSVNAHPLEIFLVIMMAGSVAGIVGMILAIPTYTILRVVAKEFFNKFKVVKKLTEKM